MRAISRRWPCSISSPPTRLSKRFRATSSCQRYRPRCPSSARSSSAAAPSASSTSSATAPTTPAPPAASFPPPASLSSATATSPTPTMPTGCCCSTPAAPPSAAPSLTAPSPSSPSRTASRAPRFCRCPDPHLSQPPRQRPPQRAIAAYRVERQRTGRELPRLQAHLRRAALARPCLRRPHQPRADSPAPPRRRHHQALQVAIGVANAPGILLVAPEIDLGQPDHLIAVHRHEKGRVLGARQLAQRGAHIRVVALLRLAQPLRHSGDVEAVELGIQRQQRLDIRRRRRPNRRLAHGVAHTCDPPALRAPVCERLAPEPSPVRAGEPRPAHPSPRRDPRLRLAVR